MGGVELIPHQRLMIHAMEWADVYLITSSLGKSSSTHREVSSASLVCKLSIIDFSNSTSSLRISLSKLLT